MTKYMSLLVSHLNETLPLAASIASASPKQFAHVASILKKDIVSVLLPELIICLILIQVHSPQLVNSESWLRMLLPLLDHLDAFNHVGPLCEREDAEDLAWPGIIARHYPSDNRESDCRGATSNPVNSTDSTNNLEMGQKSTETLNTVEDDLPIIRRCDIENNNRDGGLWVVIDRKVYDIQEFK